MINSTQGGVGAQKNVNAQEVFYPRQKKGGASGSSPGVEEETKQQILTRTDANQLNNRAGGEYSSAATGSP